MAKSTPGGARQPLAQRRPAKVAAKVPQLAKLAKPIVRPIATPLEKIARKVVGRAAPKAKAPTIAYAAGIYDTLQQTYPDAHCELDFGNAFQLLCATILSAQCTDKRVNMVTPSLFAAYPDARALSNARQEELEEIIKSTGFFRNKAKSLIGMATALVERHGGEVPRTMAELVVLPGVGRKTANVILGNAYGINDGVTVDTHVQRVSARLGLTRETDPVKIEQALMPLFPREHWTMLAHLLIFHGRRTCEARTPRCGECPLASICPSRVL